MLGVGVYLASSFGLKLKLTLNVSPPGSCRRAFTSDSGPMGSRPVAVICSGAEEGGMALLMRMMRMTSCAGKC